MQEPKPLCRKLHPNVTDPSGVAAWPIEAGNKTDFHGIGTNDEDNRDRGGRRLGRERGCSANRCNDDIHAPANQFGRQRRQALVVTVGPAILNRDIPTFDVSGFAQPLRNAATRCAKDAADALWRKPTIGTASCCACVPSGHAAAPPSSVMNSRRRIVAISSPSHVISSKRRSQPGPISRRRLRAIRLPQPRRQAGRRRRAAPRRPRDKSCPGTYS